jgi:histone chaperone ASF1
MSEDIEWKLIYVGSAESDEHDQELDSILVGPMQAHAPELILPVSRQPALIL